MKLSVAFISGFISYVTSYQFSPDEYAAYQRALDLTPMVRDDELYYGTFPEGFNWCTATSAYQIEGAWDVDGKGESIWDRKSHTGGIEGNQTGDVACNSYYQYSNDIANLVYLGVTHYRFSIAWTRIQPTGEDTEPNPAGLAYYNNVIDGLLDAGITPVVTLYHWDLPQALHEKGGWLEESVIVSAFTEYARMCFEAFGDRVKNWITINEPWVVAYLGYGTGSNAPGINGIGDLVYVAAHNLLKSHSEAWHLYDQEFRSLQNGEIGITLDTTWSEPRNRSIASDVDAAMTELEFRFGWFANPVFVNGDYPAIMKFNIAEKSALQGLNQSRLPTFTEAEQQRIFGTSDFFGLNFYTSYLLFHDDKPLDPPSYDFDRDTGSEQDPDWPTSGSYWLTMTPFGIRKILAYIDGKYGEPRILITENGISDRNDSMTDDHRVNFYEKYTNNVLQAIDLDNVDVIGYTAWSLMDNFEWNVGYIENYGLYHVDFEDPARSRTAKASANWYKQLITDNGFPPPS